MAVTSALSEPICGLSREAQLRLAVVNRGLRTCRFWPARGKRRMGQYELNYYRPEHGYEQRAVSWMAFWLTDRFGIETGVSRMSSRREATGLMPFRIAPLLARADVLPQRSWTWPRPRVCHCRGARVGDRYQNTWAISVSRGTWRSSAEALAGPSVELPPPEPCQHGVNKAASACQCLPRHCHALVVPKGTGKAPIQHGVN
ncbi:hypothetical protein B0H67DRAFT_124507 [Lasiosphaeris hirsuta]|uniref:Uncharacterized protein n=1 Tax=Lasiosphaeris hirsuta TaxID=260670 RepID=A0AA40E267_9PEZI|nr:hypothetical protein B0H67DRAFT_124507 [Lasiosphaeris hirsuta]